MDPAITPKLKGDPTRIKEILINLLSNAVKFTPFGGEINLIISQESDKQNGNRIKFEVEDNGIGITKAQQNRIFEAFTQADISITRKYGGTGLGLTISSQFVNLMGGCIELESEKGKGTRFFFSLPLEEIASVESNETLAYTDITLAKFEKNVQTKLDKYLQSYFEHFGPSIKRFHSVFELKELNKDNACKNYWIDIDKAPKDIMDTLSRIDKEKIIAIANITSRNKLESLGLDQSNIIYKPVTMTKIKSVLGNTANTNPKLIDEEAVSKETLFDAKILVTEDNIINQKLVKRILELHGVNVDIANNGQEAFEKRKTGHYDLLFMDIQMPIMDGVEATHAILKHEEKESATHVPIIALTANALKGDRERYLSEGMDEYITKPIETSELIYILNKFLSHKISTTVAKDLTPLDIPKIPTPETETTSSEVSLADAVMPPIEKIRDESIVSLDIPDRRESVEMPLKELDDTPTAIDMAQTESPLIDIKEDAKSSSPKKILVAKKYLLVRKVFEKVLDNLGYAYDTLGHMESLEDSLDSGDYDLIFTDTSLVSEHIISTYTNVAIITPQDSFVADDAGVKKGESVVTATSRQEIEDIIHKYRGV